MRRIGTVAGVLLLGLAQAQAADLAEYTSDGTIAMTTPGEARPAGAMRTFAACRSAIETWARPYSPVDLDITTVGPVQRPGGGKRVAPLFVRIVYDTEGGLETRKARLECRVDAADTVAVQIMP